MTIEPLIILTNKLIKDEKLVRILLNFSDTALNHHRGLQKETSYRELTEIIFWFALQLHNNNVNDELSNAVFDLRPFKTHTPNLPTELLNEWKKLESGNESLCLLCIDQEHSIIKNILSTGCFPYGLTLSQLNIIDGVLENYLYG